MISLVASSFARPLARPPSSLHTLCHRIHSKWAESHTAAVLNGIWCPRLLPSRLAKPDTLLLLALLLLVGSPQEASWLALADSTALNEFNERYQPPLLIFLRRLFVS